MALIQTKINKKTLSYIIVSIFVILNSGTMFQAMYGELFQQIIFVVFCLVLGCMCIKKRENLFKIKLNWFTAFLILVAVTSVLCMVIWNDYRYIILYVSNFGALFLAYVIAEKIDTEHFFKIVINFMFIVAIISLVGWMLSAEILSSGIGFDFSRGMGYRSLIVFNIIKTASLRNCGIFWEPGMYQGFLNFAILMIVLKGKSTFFNAIKILVLGLAVYTTFSTTGYIILAFLIMLLIYKLLYSVNKSIAVLLVIAFGLLFVLTNGFSEIAVWATSYLPREITQKVTDQNISFTTRVYTIAYDIELSLKNPFGVGRDAAWSLIQELAIKYGFKVNARTSAITTSFINYGFFSGFLYLFIWIKGCFNFCIRHMKCDIVQFVIVLMIMMSILNSEPMFFHLFFNIILATWLKQSKKFKIGEENENIMVKQLSDAMDC